MRNQQLKTPLENLPEDVQSYIEFLEKRNNALLGMLDPELHDYVLLLDLVGSSLAMQALRDEIRIAAGVPSTVLSGCKLICVSFRA